MAKKVNRATLPKKEQGTCLACAYIAEQAGNENFTPKDAVNRGLCNSHAQSALKAVKSGKVTWDQLVAAGKALQPSRRSMQDWFLEAAEEE